jgi:MYXO-CTERM domain-containing protein
MKSLSSLLITTTLVAISSSASAAVVSLRITEVMSSSAGTPTPTGDFFEVTNYGSSAISMSGWKMDDNSFDITKAVALNGITSIGAGESVIFIESAAGVGVNSFKTFWGGLSGVQVGYYSGSGIGFSSGGDGVILFNASAAEATRVSFGAATSGSTFYWGYNAATGVVDPSYNGLVSSVGIIGTQVTFTSSGDTGSLGTAIIPTPGAVALLGLAGLISRRRK